MNTLAHLAASLAILWLAIYAFDILGETALGVALILTFLLLLVGTFLAVHDDWKILRRRREG